MRRPFLHAVLTAMLLAGVGCQQQPDASLLALEAPKPARPAKGGDTVATAPATVTVAALGAVPRADAKPSATASALHEVPQITPDLFAGRGIDGLPASIALRYAPDDLGPRLSARCRALLAEAGVEATLLRSPSVSADIRDDLNWSVGIGYDFLDLRRATLKEEFALAQCDLSLVSLRLAQLMAVSAQSLSRTGYLAVADHLRRSRGPVASVRRRIRSAVDIGDMTVTQATLLRQYIATTMAREARMRAEAGRREIVDRMHSRSYRALDRRMREAEERVARLEEKRRTLQALSLRLSARYGGAHEDTIFDSITEAEPGDFSARVNVSVRLGALSPRRYEYEKLLREAKVDVYGEAETGIFWRAEELVRANGRVLTGLRQERRQLLDSLVVAKRTARTPGYDNQLLGSALRARVTVVALTAQLKGVEATIAHMKTVNSKLRFER